jgi:hypothetical protein
LPVRRRSRDWPQWRRREHFEDEHKRQALAAKRAVTRAAKGPPPTAASTLDQWREFYPDAEDPTAGELIEFIEFLTRGPERRSVERREHRHRSKRWRAAHAPRACRECGDTFAPIDARQVHCKPKCRKRYAYRVAKAKKAKKVALPPYGWRHVATSEPNNDGALPLTNRGGSPLICAHCGEPFEPKRTDQRFCSNACRQAAYRERKRKAALS